MLVFSFMSRFLCSNSLLLVISGVSCLIFVASVLPCVFPSVITSCVSLVSGCLPQSGVSTYLHITTDFMLFNIITHITQDSS